MRVYLAIKGGNACGASEPNPDPAVALHAQADAGTFVMEAEGERWAIDLGPDDYDLPGYFEHGDEIKPGRRWRYYRNATIGHNTLVIDGSNQMPEGRTRVVAGCAEGDCKWVVFDLTEAYRPQARKVRRGAALIDGQVVIADEIHAPSADRIIWVMHTGAEPIEVSPRRLGLTQGGKYLVLRVTHPHARFRLAVPPAPRRFGRDPASGTHGAASRTAREFPRVDEAGRPVRRIEIEWPKTARRLTVVLSPGKHGSCDAKARGFRLAPLDRWSTHGPVLSPTDGHRRASSTVSSSPADEHGGAECRG